MRGRRSAEGEDGSEALRFFWGLIIATVLSMPFWLAAVALYGWLEKFWNGR